MSKFPFFLLLAILVFHCTNDKKGNIQGPESSITGDKALIKRLNQQIAENPKDPELYFLRAQALYQAEAYSSARSDVEIAMKLDSTRFEYWHLLADIQLDNLQSQNALQTMESAVKRFPDNPLSLLKLSEFQLILQQYREGLATLDQLLRKDPQNAEAFFMSGLLFTELKDTARAINSFQTAVENEPELIDAWIKLGQLHAALGNSIASVYFDNAVELSGRQVETLHAKAFYLQSIGELLPSMELFKEIVKRNPQYTDAYFNSGLLYMDLDSLEKAIGQFDLAIQFDPALVEAYYYRGLCWEMAGRPEMARQNYEQALRMVPTFDLPQEGLDRLRQLK